jgi:hypothetical protein
MNEEQVAAPGPEVLPPPEKQVRGTRCRAYSRLAIYAEETHIKTLRSTYMKYGHWVEAAIRRTTAHAAEGMVSLFTCSFMLFPKLFQRMYSKILQISLPNTITIST